MALDLKLGKKPAKSDSRDLLLATYLDLAVLPTLPPTFGHQTLIPTTGWGMLANDTVGDCVLAGAAHEEMLWTKLGGKPATFSAATVLGDYSAITGYNPADSNTDQGTDPRAAAGYRRTTGLLDVAGHRHKINSYAMLTAGRLVELDYAIFLFGVAGVGIRFPASAMDQFNQGKPWDYVPRSKIEGGHYVVGVAKLANGNYGLITWGKLIEATPRFLAHYMDEGLGYISSESFLHRRSPEGFQLAQLKADLAAVVAA